ncbi:hypothetical protein K2Y00_02445 [Patescibacteria group bacterium]|nr:hypothetical protein [Patescibacteria group bacterium]
MADDTNFEAKLAAAYAKAPQVVREYIASGGFEKFLERIRGQYRFSSPEMATIGTEILMTLLGISTLADVKVGIKVGTNIPIRVCDDLLEDIKTSVFDPLEKKLPPAPPVSKTKPGAPIVPPKPVAPPAPINRLAPPAAPKLLPKHEDAKPVVAAAASVTPVTSVKPVPAPLKSTPPLMPKASSAPVVKPAMPAIQPPKPIAPVIPTPPPPKPASIFPPVAAPAPKSPLIAPIPSTVPPKTPAAPVAQKNPEPTKRVDPYREPVE